MNVGVFVGTRADLGPLEPIVAALHRAPDMRPVLVTGVAFNAKLLQELVFQVIGEELPVIELAEPMDATSPFGVSAQAADLSQGASTKMVSLGLDAFVVLGDRWELLALVPQAFLQGIKIVHIHGGEVTEGAIDDRVRHAVTKLADIHCVASAGSAKRVQQLGEPTDRIFVTGAPGLERIVSAPPLCSEELSSLVGAEMDGSVALATYHPETADSESNPGLSARRLLTSALAHFDTVIVTAPGFDLGRDEILTEIHQIATENSRLVFVDSFGLSFPSVLRTVDAVIGNSSAGIIEAPTAGVPTLDVGVRQKGRDRGPSIVHAACEEAALREALASLPSRLSGESSFPNPYFQPDSAARIVSAINSLPRMSRDKPFVDEEISRLHR